MLKAPIRKNWVSGKVVIAGGVVTFLGGPGLGMTAAQMYDTLSKMVRAHSLYVESLLMSYNFPVRWEP